MFRLFFVFLLITILIIPVVKVSAFDFETNGGLSTTGSAAGIKDSSVSIEGSVAKIVQEVLSLVGVLFMILMIFAGLTWMTAGGDEKKVEKARDILTAALIGLIIVLAAYAITQFIGKTFISTTP
jgi:cytochrome bd-type quinol oxidase subunit 2